MLDAMPCHAVLFHSDLNYVGSNSVCTEYPLIQGSDATTTVQHHHEQTLLVRMIPTTTALKSMLCM